MTGKVKDTDYLFLSARLRAKENRLLTQARMERMLEAPTPEDAAKVLAECGYMEVSHVDVDTVNELLSKARDEVFADLSAAVPDRRMVDVFKIKYDYHNAKVMLKSMAQGENGKRLLVAAGRVEVSEIENALLTGELDRLPKMLAESVAKARDVLSATKDPQQADFILDQAYFREMEQMANEAGSAFLLGYVRKLVDAANIRSLVRVLRMKKDADYLKSVLFEGGSIPEDRIVTASENGTSVEELYAGTPMAGAAAAGQQAVQGGSMTEFEKCCDNEVMHYLTSAKQVVFGEQPLIAYLAAKESEFTAVRIIMTGRLAGLPTDVIRERLRDAYV